MSIRLTTAPTIEPVTVSDVKCNLRIEHSDYDTVIENKIKTVRQTFERLLWQAFINQTWTLRLRCWPVRFTLPPGNLQSVTSITYLDVNGDSQTLATSEYDVNTYDLPGVVKPSSSATWPPLEDIDNAVTVAYVVGFGTAAADVPQPIREAIVVAAGHAFECEGDWMGIIDSVWSLLEPYRVVSAEALEFVS